MNKPTPELDRIFNEGVAIKKPIEDDTEVSKLKTLLLVSTLLGQFENIENPNLYSKSKYYNFDKNMKSIIDNMSKEHIRLMTKSFGRTYVKSNPFQTTVSTTQVSKALNTNWVGRTFKDSTANHINTLKRSIGKIVQDGFSSKQPIRGIMSDINKRFDVYNSRIEALVRTETQYFIVNGRKDRYKEKGYKELEYIAIIDKLTSDICLSLDGTIIPIEDAMSGINMPPMHTNCRSEVSPIMLNTTNLTQ
jgi:SPP1 gp7 family putative phage head morphogenesis protein